MGILIDVTNKNIKEIAEEVDLTPEEIAELERQAQQEDQPPEPTMDERVAELEEALELLLSGVTSDEA